MPTVDRKRRIAAKKRNAAKLTPLVHKVLVEMIRQGNYYEVAAQAAGISPDTVVGWLEQGRKGNQRYAHLAREIEKAEADSERRALEIITKCAEGAEKIRKVVTTSPDGQTTVEETFIEKDWRAAAYVLDRRYSKRWGLARKLQFSGALDHRQHVIVHTDPQDMARIIEAEEGVLLRIGEDGKEEILRDPEDEPEGTEDASG